MNNVISDIDAKRNIAFHVLRLLEKKGKSRYWLSKQTGEYESRIAAVCKGESLCKSGLLARIAEALETTTDDMLRPIPKKLRKLQNIA